jgi:hypothetical protein
LREKLSVLMRRNRGADGIPVDDPAQPRADRPAPQARSEDRGSPEEEEAKEKPPDHCAFGEQCNAIEDMEPCDKCGKWYCGDHMKDHSCPDS